MANKVNKAPESFTTSLHNYIKYYTLTRNIKLTYISNVGSNINHVTVAGNIIPFVLVLSVSCKL